MFPFTAGQLLHLNAFHLDGVNRTVAEALKNETIISPANQTHNLTEITAPTLQGSEGKPLSGGKPSTKIDEAKIYGKPWRASKHTVAEKSLNSRNIPSHPKPKRESAKHPTWHKNFKDSHKFGSANSANENVFNGFDIVVVDIPPSYSELRWDKPHINSLTSSPSYRYVPGNPSPSIFDFFMGLNSVAGNFLTDPAEMENEIYYQQSLENPLWNRRLSIDRLMSPATIHQKTMVNGDRIAKEVNAVQLFGKLSEPIKNCTCTCGARNRLR